MIIWILTCMINDIYKFKEIKYMKIIITLIFLVFQIISIKVDTNNTLFVDQYNRYTVYHGVNAIQKLFPFYP